MADEFMDAIHDVWRGVDLSRTAVDRWMAAQGMSGGVEVSPSMTVEREPRVSFHLTLDRAAQLCRWLDEQGPVPERQHQHSGPVVHRAQEARTGPPSGWTEQTRGHPGWQPPTQQGPIPERGQEHTQRPPDWPRR
jgi:hypothetical protein